MKAQERVDEAYRNQEVRDCTLAGFIMLVLSRPRIVPTYVVQLFIVRCSITFWMLIRLDIDGWQRWTKMSIMNTAGSPKFSSDRTIHEYAKEIWGIDAYEVP